MPRPGSIRVDVSLSNLCVDVSIMAHNFGINMTSQHAKTDTAKECKPMSKELMRCQMSPAARSIHMSRLIGRAVQKCLQQLVEGLSARLTLESEHETVARWRNSELGEPDRELPTPQKGVYGEPLPTVGIEKCEQ